MARDVEAIVRQFEDLKERRTNWDTHWKEIAERVWPDADEFLTRREPGEKRTERIFDSTAALALEKFAAAMESLLTPRAQRWHRLRASDEALNQDPAVKAYFERVNDVLFRLREHPRANYYSQMHEGYKSLGAFGTTALYVDEHPTGGIQYRHCHIGGVYIEQDHHGKIDTVYRHYEMSAKAAAQRWGRKLQVLAPRVAQKAESRPWERCEFLHFVAPNPTANPYLPGTGNRDFQGLYISLEDKAVLDESGYHEQPYLVSRYTVNPRELYGRSPAMLVLPSIKMLQEMQRTFIAAGHKVVDPPLLLHDDGLAGAGSHAVRIRPGGLNYGALTADGKPLIAPLITGARLDLTEGMLEREREVVLEAFLVTLFRILVDEPRMTATEALIRLQEKGQLIAPTVGRQQSEMLGPQIGREIGIAYRQGLLDEPPEALREAGSEYEIIYESQATQLQKQSSVTGMQRVIEIVTPFAAADPTVLDLFNVDEIARQVADATGAPTQMLRDPEELAAMRAERQKMQEQQMMLAAAQQVAATAKDAATAQATAPQPQEGPGGRPMAGAPATP